jgi:type IV pilus assembly protein PilA
VRKLLKRSLQIVALVVVAGFAALLARPGCGCPNFGDVAQLGEGLPVAEGVKSAVAEYYAATSVWPRDLQTLGYDTPPNSAIVSEVTVANGVVSIVYSGPHARRALRGGVLSLAPSVNAVGDIAWVCGHALPPDGFIMAGPAGSTIAPKLLPLRCRQSKPQPGATR